ncbi:MAG TPA: DegT/DnrJ/EryC1/StrS family aminotransferase, partial [Caldilineaceae bacterium]|nr:DegT/DnrJ/EryC1/StrS family aminotransferase [Caldilineaceae bacterium]
MEPIPFIDLRDHYLALRGEIDAAVARALNSGWYILGQEVAAFEAEFAAYLSQKGGTPLGCVGVNSGTDALHLALRACGVGSGDEVITVSHTAVATAAAVRLVGATPVFVDVDPVTYTLDPAALAAAITPRTKAVIPVHLYGHPADLEAILAVARPAGLRVIEDCAQAHGATYRGRAVGAWGDLGCFSFYPTKNLGALGDGGAVVSRDPALVEQVRLLREYGWTPQTRYVSQTQGMNSRLDEVQAAILRAKLPYLDKWNETRRALAARYADHLP